MANLQNLKPFQKGHKKLGGRKKRSPNKNSLSLDKVIIEPSSSLAVTAKDGGALGILSRS